jgi:hypothetical protein
MRAVATSLVLIVALSGCAIAPYDPYSPSRVPYGVVYIAPTYPVPGVGWVWVYHPQYGWGYRHPHHGWHRGWR